MDKTQLLEAIERKELARLNKLSEAELKREYVEWFGIDMTEIKNKGEMIPDLMTDFMQYRNDSGIEELKELL